MVSLVYLHQNRLLEDLPFWQDLAAAHPGPILELGCGSGRITHPLAAQGVTVFGLDRSWKALRHLAGAASAPASSHLHLLQADFRDFRLAAQFGLMLMPCNTLSSLTDAERRSLFARVRAHLAQGGLFVASMPNPARLAALPPEGEPTLEDAFYHPETGDPVQVSSAWRRTDRFVTVSWHYDHLQPDGTVQRETVHTRQSLAPMEAYAEEISAAGLHLDRCFGDYEGTPFTPDSPHLILLAGRT